MTKEELLAEVEDLLRTMPDRGTIGHEIPENYSWVGRLNAVLTEWNPIKSAGVSRKVDRIFQGNALRYEGIINEILITLNQARHDLRMQTIGPLSRAIDSGQVFDYFDEIRQVIEAASRDVLFVDPYLDAEFVSRYLGHISDGVSIRLLAREKLATLLPAVDEFSKQSGKSIAVRTAPGFHDRFVFVDDSSCYQSGASFKDGAKKAPTTLTQITDAFSSVQDTYEKIWKGADVIR